MASDSELEDLMAMASGGTAAKAASGIDAITSAALRNRAAMVASGQAARDASGRFVATSESTKAAAGGMSGFRDACNRAAGAIQKVGSVATSLSGGAIPSTTAAFTAAGVVIGQGITGACDAAAAGLSKLGPEGEAAGKAIQALGVVASATVGTLMVLMGIAVDVTEKVGLMGARLAGLAGSAAGGKAVEAMVGRLSSQLPFATSQIREWASGLLKAGVAGKDLERATRALAAAEALGEGGAAAAQTMIAKLAAGGKEADAFVKQFHEGGGRAQKMLREMGLSMADLGGRAKVAKMTAGQLNDAIQKALIKKGGGPMAEMGMSLSNMLEKAQEGFRSLFSGLAPAVKPFSAALKELFGQFNKGGAATKGMRPIVTAVFSTIFGWATKVVRAVTEIVKALSGSGKPGMLTTIVTVLKAVFTNAMTLKGIKIIFTTIAIVIGAVIAVVGFLAAAFATAVSAILAVVGAIGSGLSAAATAIYDWVVEGTAALSGLASGAANAASNFIRGLVDGISAGAGAVMSAISGLASSAVGAFKSALGMHSPSVILKAHGKDDMAGAVAGGVDAGTPAVEKSMAKMGDKAADATGGGGAGGGGKGGGGDHYHFHYAGPAEDSASFFEQATQWLSQLRNEAPVPS